MKTKLKKFLAVFCALTMAGGVAVMAGCNPADGNKDDEGNNPPVINPGDNEDGQTPGGNEDGQTPGGEETILSSFDAYPGIKGDLIASITTHAEGEATYRFEAECTDIRGKSGMGYSGPGLGSTMMVNIGNNNACFSYLYKEGMTVNFIVVSDRDVDNAELSFCLGAEYMDLLVDSELFTVRVDTVAEEDLKPIDENGALGSWDELFINYDGNMPEDEYIIFECPIDAKISGKNSQQPTDFQEFLITTSLKLYEGVNCISLVISGKDLEGDTGTMECQAPCVDYMKITTEAQLGFYNQQNNNYGTDGLTIVS